MKAKLRGTIRSMKKHRTDAGSLAGADVVLVELDIQGSVEDCPTHHAKEVIGTMTVNLKQLVAEKLLFGEKVYVTISTEEP